MVFPQDKFRSVLLSRSLMFLLMEVFKGFSLILVWQLHPQYRVMSLGKGFLALLPVRKKCAIRREFECEGARALELTDAGGL